MYKVFVGGLPFATTDDELREIFEAHGKVASAAARVLVLSNSRTMKKAKPPKRP
jgi:RNA recognition motif-containing protein